MIKNHVFTLKKQKATSMYYYDKYNMKYVICEQQKWNFFSVIWYSQP